MNDSHPALASGFIVTKEYKRFVEFCDACRRDQYIGLCYGKPGVGKTLSARHYAHWDQLQVLTNRTGREEDLPPQPDLMACDTLVYTAAVTNTPRKIEEDIRSLRFKLAWFRDEMAHVLSGQDYAFDYAVPDVTRLILVDEADRLAATSLEQLRDIYDRGQVGLVLIGMPGLEKRLSRYPQLYSRVGFAHQFKTLSDEEMRFILKYKWAELGLKLDLSDFTDTEALAAMVQITAGNFRLIQRLFAQIERILDINHLQTITKEVVGAARANLVIGVL